MKPDPTMDTNTTPDSETNTPVNPHDPKRVPFVQQHWKLLLMITTAVCLVLLGSYYIERSTAPEETTTSSSVIDSLLAEGGGENTTGPVAIVNGEEISRTDYENSVRELANTTARQGFTVTDATVAAQIRQQAVAILINTRLLVQAAEAAALEVTELSVEEQYQAILTDMGDAEVLRLTLQDMGMTEADLRADIREQLVVDQLIQQETDFLAVTVNEADVAAYYEAISANNPELPPLENIAAELEANLRQQKQQQVVSDYIQTLRAEAEIEVLI